MRGNVKRIGEENAQLKYTGTHGMNSQSSGDADRERALRAIGAILNETTGLQKELLAGWPPAAITLIPPKASIWNGCKAAPARLGGQLKAIDMDSYSPVAYFPFMYPVTDDLLIKIPGKVEATSEHPNIVTSRERILPR